MKVKNLLKTKGKDVVSIDAGSSVEDAIRLMNDKKISALIVAENSNTVGLFTERDVVKCYVATSGKSFKDIAIKDAMTTNLIVAEQNDDISEIMCVMIEKNIRHLPVVEKARVIGMLSIRDIVQTQVSKLTSEIHYLKDYITSR
ncbi:MAG: CBS domain-containing protein [Nitrospirota bacterium]|nr:CBS domain-containing protein [Nitrospirota bacterium]